MSAWLVSKAHIDVIVWARQKYADYLWKEYSDDELGRALWETNAENIRDKYGDAIPAEVSAYTYAKPRRHYDLITCAKAVACLRYQSCDFDGWEDSPADAFTYELEHELMSQYVRSQTDWTTAPWGID